MKKIVLMFNLFATLLFSFSLPVHQNIEEDYINASVLNYSDCDVNDSVVTITTTHKLISVSGVIVDSDEKYVYIATSYAHYNKSYNYEIVFNDFTRVGAQVLGVAKEDEILLLKTEKENKEYCSVKYSKSEYLDLYERVEMIGKYNYKPAMAESVVSAIGVCKNCEDDTYKNYYYTLLVGDVSKYIIGAGVFDQKGVLLGIVTGKDEKFKFGIQMLDVNKLYSISYNLIKYGKYHKNYIKYNLLNVNSLTNYEKYLYSLDEETTDGVLVSSVHYLNYVIDGLNQGMVILAVNNVKVSNKYELDKELSKYEDHSVVCFLVKTIFGSYKTYKVKL